MDGIPARDAGSGGAYAERMHVPPFARPELPPEALQHYLEARSRQVVPFERLAAVAGAVSVLGFAIWDWEVDPNALGDTIPIRLGLAVLLGLLFAATFTRWGRHHGPLQVMATATLVGGFSWVLTELPNGFTIGVAGLTISIALLPLIAVSLQSMVILCAVAVVVPNLLAAGTDATRFTFVNTNVWLGFAVALALSFWWVLDGVNRRLFLAEAEAIEQRERADRLLFNMLPPRIADRLKVSNDTVAEGIDGVSVMFADIVGFTAFAHNREPDVVVELLNDLFGRFDDLVAASHLEKIKTIGDGYMVAGGVPAPHPDHAREMADLALAMVAATADFALRHGIDWTLRIGIHTGSAVAGVIGKQKLAYDLWGDAVNVASRLETSGVAGRIQVSGAFARLLSSNYELERRGTITLKNRGSATTYFLVGRSAGAGADTLPERAGPDGSPPTADAARQPQIPAETAKTATAR